MNGVDVADQLFISRIWLTEEL